MENRTYLVTEAEKLTGEKAHVLRYWEDELGMEIHRNSLGHRCYTAQDIHPSPASTVTWQSLDSNVPAIAGFLISIRASSLTSICISICFVVFIIGLL